VARAHRLGDDVLMTRAIRSGVMVALLGMAVVACDRTAPQAAAGFRRDKVGHLRYGMSVEEVSRVLGPPVTERPRAGGGHDADYIYAMAGRRGVTLGKNHLWTGTGPTCWVTIRSGLVEEVFVRAGGSVCICRSTGCPPTWVAACASGIPE